MKMLDGDDDVVEAVEPEVQAAEEVEEQEESGEIVVSLGDEEEQEERETSEAPDWVKDLRRRTKEQERQLREKDRQLKELLEAKKEKEKLVLGKRPELHDEGIEYDADIFAERLLEWNNKKLMVEQQQAEERKVAEESDRVFQERVAKYNDAKKVLGVEDFDDAESVVVSTLSAMQQGIIVAHAERPDLVVYALGRNPKEAERLAKIKDPIAFALEMRDLEKLKMKVTRKPSTAPEREVHRSSSVVSSTDRHLERLEAEAAKTGDRSKIVAYKRQLKNKG